MYAFSFFSCFVLGCVLYCCYSFKAEELPIDENDDDDNLVESEGRKIKTEDLEIKESEKIDESDINGNIEGFGFKNAKFEIIEDEREVEKLNEKAPNVNNAKVTYTSSVKHISIAVHNVALGILVVGLTVKGKTENQCGMIYDLKNGNLKGVLKLDTDAELKQLKIDPVHQQIIGSFKTNAVAIWNLDGSLDHQFDSVDEVNSLADGSFRPLFVDSLSSDNLKRFNPYHLLPLSHRPSSDYILNDTYAFSKQSFMYHDAYRDWLIHSTSNKINVFQLTDQTIVQEFDCYTQKILYSQEKGYLIDLTSENSIVVQDLINRRKIQSFILKEGNFFWKVNYHQESNRIVAYMNRKEYQKSTSKPWVVIWDVASGKCLNHFEVGEDPLQVPNCLLYLPQFNLLFTEQTLFDNDCHVWDLETETLIKKITLPGKHLPTCQMSYDRQMNQLYINKHHYEDSCETYIIDLS